jgi:hypothetical protein
VPESNQQILANAQNYYRSYQFAKSIGAQSQQLKRGHWRRRLVQAAVGVGAVLVSASIIGGIINGLGFWGVMATAGALAAAAYVGLNFPRMPMPTPETLVKSDLKTLAGKTEIWLEQQRPALPAPAVTLVEGIGVQLDQLSPQLAKLDEREPAAYEVRKLVGEHLPQMINAYRAIPVSLRGQSDGGKSPEQALVDGLGLIEREIASVTQQIAKGDIDKLQVQGRFLELKYDKSGQAE